MQPQGMHCFQGGFRLYKKVSTQKGAMLDCSKKLLYNKMAKPPWVHGRGLDTFLRRRAFNCSKGRRMHNAWTKEAPEHL